jgi:endoglucanase
MAVPRGSKFLAIVLAATATLAACASSQPAAAGAGRHRLTGHRESGVSRADSPLASLRLWVNPHSSAAQPTAVWLGGANGVSAEVAALVGAAQRAHAVAQIVLYAIPDRDCGGYSSGGAPDASAYETWVRQVVRGLGDHPAIVILEPDAIDQAASGCIGAADANKRYGMLANATQRLRHDPSAHIYLDAGGAGWLSPQQIVEPLRLSGIAADAGFALNVANFYTTSESIAYGRRLSTLLNGKHFVIDTSRNGNGPPPAEQGVNKWCNPPGRALGHIPTTDTGNSLVDAFLWIKYPGQSDGTCLPGEPPPGAWWPSYALGLVHNERRRAPTSPDAR